MKSGFEFQFDVNSKHKQKTRELHSKFCSQKL